MADDAGDRSKGKLNDETVPAPPGWHKKFMPKKGGTPRRNDIYFISPTGEEIKSKKQLDQYLKSHPGGPESSEFDWGTGDTPRRSSRLSVKAKAIETPEDEKPKKREKKTAAKEVAKDKSDVEGEDDTVEAKNNATEEAKDPADVEMKDADEAGKKVEVEGTDEDGKKVEVEGADEDGKKVDLEGADEDGKKVDLEGADVVVTVNKKGDVEVAVDKGTTVEIAVEDVKEGTTEQNSENKTESVIEEPVVFAEEKNGLDGASKVDEYAVDVPKDQTEVQVTPNDTKLLPATSAKDAVSAENGQKEGEVLPENGSQKDNEGTPAAKETPPVNYEDGQHQPKTNPISC